MDGINAQMAQMACHTHGFAKPTNLMSSTTLFGTKQDGTLNSPKNVLKVRKHPCPDQTAYMLQMKLLQP